MHPWAHREVRTEPGSNPVASEWLHYVNDPSGMPDRLISPSGKVAFELRATAWGRAEGPGAAATPLRFGGQYYDEETGLSYNRFRYYDPTLGRYLSTDPIGLQGGLNGFSYADNQPTGRADPMGLMPESVLVDKTAGETHTGSSSFKGPLDGAIKGPVTTAMAQQPSPNAGQCAEIEALNKMAGSVRKQNPTMNDEQVRAEMARRMRAGEASISTEGSKGPMRPCPCCAQVFYNMGIAEKRDRKEGKGVPGVKIGKENWDGRTAQIAQGGFPQPFNPK
jgi:RHS repeat-associated protein